MSHDLLKPILGSIKADFFLGLRIAYHSRLSSILFWILFALTISVLLVIQFSARQPATVALDVGISVIRLTLPLLSVLLIQELIGKEFERKLYLNSFTYPRNRSYWLIGRVLAIFLIGIALLVAMGILLALLTLYAGSTYPQATPVSLRIPYLITLALNIADLLVVLAIGTLLAVTATTQSFILLGTIGFVLIARSYTPIIELLRNKPYVVSNFIDPRLYQDSLGLLSFILPDLGRLDVRMIALYDKLIFLPQDWFLLLGATLFYASALLGLSVWIINKREFN